jgi:maleylacetoacetate isomerase
LKGLDVETISHDLTRNAHHAPAYCAINPQGLVPTLEDGPLILPQSLAIIEYLDARWPDPPLLPSDEPGRARVRALAQMIAADTHPLASMRVASYLRTVLGQDEAAIRAWQHHWLHESFRAFEVHLEGHPSRGRFCHGDTPTLADIALVPQAVAALRLDFPLADYVAVTGVVDTCLDLPAFRRAHPDVVVAVARE